MIELYENCEILPLKGVEATTREFICCIQSAQQAHFTFHSISFSNLNI